MIRFGISGLPQESDDDGEWLDAVAAQGYQAVELSFTKGFPWKEKRCAAFGKAAADRTKLPVCARQGVDLAQSTQRRT